MVRDCAGWTPRRSHSHDGMAAIVSGVGCTHQPQRRDGRPGGGLAVAPYELAERAERLLAGDLLLQDRGHQRLHHQPGRARCASAVGRQPSATSAWWCGSKPLRVVVGAEQRRHPVERPLRSRTPGPAEDLAAPGPRAARTASPARPACAWRARSARDSSARWVGSPAPRRCGRAPGARRTASAGRHSRTSAVRGPHRDGRRGHRLPCRHG